jgi:hypothetical protein
MARSRDISKVLSSNTTLATDAEVAASYQTKATAGLTLLTPTSIVATGGSGSISTNGAVSFTSASAISLNGVFSSTYENYLGVLNCTTGSSAELSFRLRVAGTDATGANYNSGFIRIGGSSTNTGLTFGGLAYSSIANNYYCNFTLFKPFLTEKTGHISHWYNPTIQLGNIAGEHQLTTSYDSISFRTDLGTFTGTVSVYGYNK